MSRKMYQGGSSRKQGPRPMIREPDDEPPREAQVWPCEWPSEEFMVQEGIKDEFDAYMRNAHLEYFVSDKCSGAMLVNLADLNIKTFLLVSLWVNLEKSHKLP